MVLCFYKTFGLRCSWDFGVLAYNAWFRVFGLGCSLAFLLKTIGLRPKTDLEPKTIGLRPKTFVLSVGTIGLGPMKIGLRPRTI